MLSKVLTSALKGINAVEVSVEVDISRGFPGINVVGLGDATVKEAAARIKSAIKNSGYEYPMSNITVNLSPAWIRKKGSQFDLPMAIGILISSGQVFDCDADKICFVGELSLDGRLNRCNGIMPIIKEMSIRGIKAVIIPDENKNEGALFDNIEVYSAKNLSEVCDALNMKSKLQRVKPKSVSDIEGEIFTSSVNMDFKDVKGQEFAKRAITAAVSGGHGILITGSPGTGKTMLAERIPGIMPNPNYEEIIEMTSVYSASGLIDGSKGYISERPFRRIGPAITKAGLVGGGTPLRAGEITLAHKGVLFIDEFYEMDKAIMESLRLPLESKYVGFIRNGENYIFPADFMLVAAANPCRCGYYGDSNHECRCSQYEIERYRNRVSGPILDRIDMNIELQSVDFDVLQESESTSSSDMREVIENARKRQIFRYRNERFSLNSQLTDSAVEQYVKLGRMQNVFLGNACSKLGINPRGVFKIKKLARTVADLEDEENISEKHIAEALGYRERKVK